MGWGLLDKLGATVTGVVSGVGNVVKAAVQQTEHDAANITNAFKPGADVHWGDGTGATLSKAGKDLFGPKSGLGAGISLVPEVVRRDVFNPTLRFLDQSRKSLDLSVAQSLDGGIGSALMSLVNPVSIATKIPENWGEAGRLTDTQAAIQARHPSLYGRSSDDLQAYLDKHPGEAVQASIIALLTPDPSLAAGKAISAVRGLRLLTDVDTGATRIARAGMTSQAAKDRFLTSDRMPQVSDKIGSLIDQVGQKQAIELVQQKLLKDHPFAGQIAHAISEPDAEIRLHTIGALLGDKTSAQLLRDANRGRYDEVNNLLHMQNRLEYELIPGAKKQLRNDPTNAAAEEALSEAKALKGLIESQRTDLSNRLTLSQDLVGKPGEVSALQLGSTNVAIPTGRTVKNLDKVPRTWQGNRFQTPVYFNGFTSRRASVVVNPHSVDSWREVSRFASSLGATKEQVAAHVGDYLSQVDIAGRTASLARVESEVVGNWLKLQADRRGSSLSQDHLEQLMQQMRQTRVVTDPTKNPIYGPEMAVLNDKGEWVTGKPIQQTVDVNGTSHVIPNLESQTPADFHLPDVIKMRRLVANVLTPKSALPTRLGAAADAFNEIWKPATLMRVNYIPRNVIDPIINGFALRGPNGYVPGLKTRSIWAELVAGATNIPKTAIEKVLDGGRSRIAKAESVFGAGNNGPVFDVSQRYRSIAGRAAGKIPLKIGNDTVFADALFGESGQHAIQREMTAVGNSFYDEALTHGNVSVTQFARSVPKDDPNFLTSWDYAIKRQIRQSALGNKILSGANDVEISHWMVTTRQGRSAAGRIGVLPEDIHRHAVTAAEMVHATVPQELIDFAGGIKGLNNIGTKELQAYIDGGGPVPLSVHGHAVSMELGIARWQQAVRKSVGWFFNTAGHIEDQAARIPIANSVYKQSMKNGIESVLEIKAGEVADMRRFGLQSYAQEHGLQYEIDAATEATHFVAGVQMTPLGSQHVLIPMNQLDDYSRWASRSATDIRQSIADGDIATVGKSQFHSEYKHIESWADPVDPLLLTQAKVMAQNVGDKGALHALNQLSPNPNYARVDDIMRRVRTADRERWLDQWENQLVENLRINKVGSFTTREGHTVVIEPDGFALNGIPKSHDLTASLPKGMSVTSERGFITNKDLANIQEYARAVTLGAARRAFYDASSTSVASAVSRHILPFAGATEDAIRRYSVVLRERPDLVVKMVNIYNAPNRVGLVVDSNGNQVGVGSSVPASEQSILVPRVISDVMTKGLAALTGTRAADIGQLKISRSTINFLVQADIGVGPLAQIPLSLYAKNHPDFADSVGAFFPYGVPTSITASLTPSTIQSIEEILGIADPNKQLLGLTNQAIQTEHTRYQLGLRSTDVTAVEASNIARHSVMVGLLAKLVLPTIGSARTASPYQPYIDSYRRHEALLKNDKNALADETGHPRDAATWFTDTYGQEMNALIVGQSKNLYSGAGSSQRAYENQVEYKDLITSHPDIAALIIGPDTAADTFSRNVYNLQVASGQVRKLSPDEYLNKVQAADGWKKYNVMDAKVKFALAQRNLPNLQVKAAQDLADYKRQYVEALTSENPAWAEQHGKIDTGKWARMRAGFTAVLEDPTLSKRPDMVALADYLHVREQVLSLVAARNKRSLNVAGNEDLVAAWESTKERFDHAYPAVWTDLYNRWLDRDPMIVGQ